MPPYSTMSFPRNIPMGQAKVNSPGSFGISSTGTVSPIGSAALFWKSAKITLSEQVAVSSRRKFRLTGRPARTMIGLC